MTKRIGRPPANPFPLPNPIAAQRLAAGLTRAQAALKMGCNYGALCALELGHVGDVSDLWRGRFAAMGWDADQLAADYTSWRTACASAPLPIAAEG